MKNTNVETSKKNTLPAFSGRVCNSCMSTPDSGEKENKMGETTKKQREKKGYAGKHLKGSIQKYDLEVKNRDIIEAYDRAQTGTQEDKDAYTMLVYDKLKYLIMDHIKQYGFQYKTDYEDLMSAGKVAVFEKISSYDPRQSMPASFFGPKIDEMLKKCNHGESHMSEHYISMLAKLNQAARQAGYADCSDPELTPELLQILTGLPLTTVVNTLEQYRIKISSMDDPEMENTPPSISMSPEKAVLDKIEDRELIDAVQSLSPYERFVFLKYYNIAGEVDENGKEINYSLRKIYSMISSDPKLMERLGLKKVPDINKISRDIEIARRKISYYGSLRKEYHCRIPQKDSNPGYEPYEQAEIEDLANAIELIAL